MEGSYIRCSIHTASWERAQGLAQEIESADDPEAEPKRAEQSTTIKTAGHGGASARYNYLKEIVFDYAFLLRLLGIAE